MKQLLLALIAAHVCISPLVAQTRFNIELRGGPAISTEDLGPASLETGFGLGASFGVMLMPHLSVYAGWDWHMRTTETPFAGSDFDVEDTGYEFGLNFAHPVSDMFGVWVRAGGIFNHIELENSAGVITDDSGHELGFEVGGGVSYMFTESVGITPGVRFRSFSADLSGIPADLSYVKFEMGVKWFFGPELQ